MQANQTVGRQLSCVPLDESQEASPGEACRAPLSAIDAIAGKSAAVQHVLNQAQLVAATDSTVLLLGETGTGKERFAAYIHQLSARRTREMVCVNCAAIPATLIESELFGRERGAYTDANSQQIGRFELAHRSTIFLDEIGDLPFEVQVKLLRVLEERQIERLGSVKSINVDTRIIAATHRSLEQRIAGGGFRADLFYRLNVFPLRVPPLRERVEDVPLLVWRFIEEFSTTFGKRIEEVPAENMAALQRYSWPGNIRELRNAVERAMILANGPRLTVSIPTPLSVARLRSLRLVDVQKEHIRQVLETAGWRVRGSGGAAVRLGLRPTTLETRMAKLGLSRPRAS
jgi:transcriptional regulator with GAF, ATPase, and Fis domain